MTITNIHLWTDSQVTPKWIKVHPSKWKDYVRNRVIKIQDRTKAAHWRHVPGTSNPDDSWPAQPDEASDDICAQETRVKATQAAYFQDELALLRQQSHLQSSHSLSQLTAFIDNEGVLRVGGRLRRSEPLDDTKHPAILPRTSRLSELIIAHAHKKTMTEGTQTTLVFIRQLYWIVGGPAPVKSHILSLTTSATNLEVVSDYTSELFISTYRRFISRRGTPSALYSDCGTNFLGANAQLKRCFAASSPGYLKFSALLAQDNTQWHFNQPAAPHMGGKWEAAVKSLKFHVEHTVGETLLTYEEASTLLVQIEAILYSRPLEPLSDDPEDTTVLTPGHFLIWTALNALLEHSLLDVSVNRMSRWQFIQQRMQQFWRLCEWLAAIASHFEVAAPSQQYTDRLSSSAY
ncbi:uncharacterized protein LOC122520450 [Polistes fuscatus]|uniref:uncharacterized protein LOC122520450 n=1 Tax=Polistes fuscatus TaxID=30207 RepID=UPI001CA913CC|nr:uncharacterized protein LOC122520450 [Polistes fuscatus]